MSGSVLFPNSATPAAENQPVFGYRPSSGLASSPMFRSPSEQKKPDCWGYSGQPISTPVPSSFRDPSASAAGVSASPPKYPSLPISMRISTMCSVVQSTIILIRQSNLLRLLHLYYCHILFLTSLLILSSRRSRLLHSNFRSPSPRTLHLKLSIFSRSQRHPCHPHSLGWLRPSSHRRQFHGSCCSSLLAGRQCWASRTPSPSLLHFRGPNRHNPRGIPTIPALSLLPPIRPSLLLLLCPSSQHLLRLSELRRTTRIRRCFPSRSPVPSQSPPVDGQPCSGPTWRHPLAFPPPSLEPQWGEYAGQWGQSEWASGSSSDPI